MLPCLPPNHEISQQLKKHCAPAGSISDYLYRNAAYPVYQNTDVTYYPEAVQGLEAQLADLAKAEKFIFMEYHAIENADAWQKIQTVLAERVQAGVEVRVFMMTWAPSVFSIMILQNNWKLLALPAGI